MYVRPSAAERNPIIHNYWICPPHITGRKHYIVLSHPENPLVLRVLGILPGKRTYPYGARASISDLVGGPIYRPRTAPIARRWIF